MKYTQEPSEDILLELEVLKSKIQLNKLEDLVGFKRFMSLAASHLQLEGSSEGLYKIEGFKIYFY